ncbi:hypothetical protein, partial [Salmonella enterica]|uniref:hypothetical protein n=1 Tax=Salmonella enterica TaxID=28901 RepID=UPI001EE7F368
KRQPTPVRNTRLTAVDVIVCKRKFPNISIFNSRFLFIAVRKYRNLMQLTLSFYTEKHCNLMNLLI